MRSKKEFFRKRSSSPKTSKKPWNKIFRLPQSVLQTGNIDILDQESVPKDIELRQNFCNSLCLASTIIENQIHVNT